jgi:aryl sulfotransferase
VTEGSDRRLVRRSTILEDNVRWEGFEFRPDDIIISTPSKCGTTWVQMITALLVFQSPELPAPLSTLSPWLDNRFRARRNVVADLEKQAHRRFYQDPHCPMGNTDSRRCHLYLRRARPP